MRRSAAISMSYNLNSLNEVIQGITTVGIKGDTRNLDDSSYTLYAWPLLSRMQPAFVSSR